MDIFYWTLPSRSKEASWSSGEARGFEARQVLVSNFTVYCGLGPGTYLL